MSPAIQVLNTVPVTYEDVEPSELDVLREEPCEDGGNFCGGRPNLQQLRHVERPSTGLLGLAIDEQGPESGGRKDAGECLGATR